MDADKDLQKLKKIGKVEAPPFLYTRIRARIDSFAEAPAPMRWRITFAAAAAIVLALNIGIIMTSPKTQEETTIATVVNSMSLASTYELYYE